MSEILFGQSYFLRFDPKLWQAMQPYPPLGTLYAASLLRHRGYSVALFDAMLAESEAGWETMLRDENPRFAVIFEDSFNYLSKMCLSRMRQAAFIMLKMAKKQGCTTIVCGSDASDHVQEYLNQGADFVLIGEGEQTLVELVDRLSSRSPTALETILGLASPAGTNPPRPDLKDLDELPFPAWDLVDVECYRRIWQENHGYYSMNIVAARGCPFHCNWCAKPIWGQRYNTRTPENVAAEMKWLKETYHPDQFAFVDDIFGLKPGWLKHFAGAVQAQQAQIPFKCLNRVDLLQREGEIDALRQAGCRMVWVGAESGSQAILDAMDKGTRVEQIVETTGRLHTAGIRVGFFLQFGYPGETRQDIEKTFKLVRECEPDDIGASVSYPLPGTPFYQAVKQELGSKQNWDDSSDLAMLYRGPFSTAFYRQLHAVLHKEFRLRKAWRQLWDPGSRKSGLLLSLLLLAQAGRALVSLPFSKLKLEWLARDAAGGLDRVLPHMPEGSASQPTPQEE